MLLPSKLAAAGDTSESRRTCMVSQSNVRVFSRPKSFPMQLLGNQISELRRLAHLLKTVYSVRAIARWTAKNNAPHISATSAG